MARQKKKSRVGTLIIILVVIFFAQDWLNSPSNDQLFDGGIENLPAEATFARSFRRNWPQLSDQSSAVDNLTTNNYYIVLDGSGSMDEKRCSGNKTKMEAAKDAVIAFSSQFPRDSNLGLAVFDGQGLSERVPLGGSDPATFASEVSRISAGGGTPLLNSVYLAYQKLEEQARRQLGYGEYHLVVVTDGEANTGQDPTQIVNQIMAESPVVLHTIGFCIGDYHSLNQEGRIDYRAADNIPALREGLTSVLAEAPDFTVTTF